MKRRFPKAMMKNMQRFAHVSPQNKMINTGDKFGNSGLKSQQGSTRVIYDSLVVDGGTNYTFFENANARTFPLTNLTEGKLGVGETMVIERAYFAFITVDDATGNIVQFEALDGEINSTTGEFKIEQANQIVMKPVPVMSMLSQFNKDAEFDTDVSFSFDTQLTLQPLLEFKVNVRFGSAVPAAAVGETKYMRCTLEGAGAIISTGKTF